MARKMSVAAAVLIGAFMLASFVMAFPSALWLPMRHLFIHAPTNKHVPVPAVTVDAKAGNAFKLLCWVLTTTANHDSKVKTIALTWGSQCDTLLFMSTVVGDDPRIVALNVTGNESRMLIWPKVRQAWSYVYQQYASNDWFVKADDDTFIAVGNLREYLAEYNQSEPYYLGRHFAAPVGVNESVHYNSGGAGYVLSRSALISLHQSGGCEDSTSASEAHSEDVEMGLCLARIGIHPQDTRDQQGRERFLPMPLEALRYRYTRDEFPTLWYWSFPAYPPKEGLECCSSKWVSAHYVSEHMMHRYFKTTRHAHAS